MIKLLFDILDLMESRKANIQEVDTRIDKLTDSVNKLVEVIIPTEPTTDTTDTTDTDVTEKEMEE